MARILCPKCKNPGFLTKRYVYSSYRPRRYSKIVESHIDYTNAAKKNPAILDSYVQTGNTLTKLGHCMRLMNQRITGNEYFNGENTTSSYMLRTRKHFHWYVGHYIRKSYEIQMERFKRGELKSRPNGRRWCKMKPEDMVKLGK